MESVIGDWHVEVRGVERRYRVSYANTFDEPVGGLTNGMLTEDGQHSQHSDINGGAFWLLISVAFPPITLPSVQVER